MTALPLPTAPRRAAALFYCCALLLGLAACDGTNGPDPVQPPRALTTQEQTVAATGTNFGLRLFRRVNASEEAGDNVFVSPLSVSMALGMTLNGAEGDTRAGMEEALALQGLSQKEINASYQSLIALLAGLDPQVRFSLANSIWHRDDFAVEQPFIDVNKEYFDAEVAALDFDSDEAAGTINDWVDEKTEGKIEKIVPARISPGTVMYLINAVYFKGTWQYQFDESKTKKAPFTLADGTEKQVNMMTLEGAELPFYRSGDLAMVDLPYGGGPFAMTLLVPTRRGPSTDSLAATLDAARWRTLAGRLQKHEVAQVKLPRFTLGYEKTLNDVLKAMGLEEAFDARLSDFSGINEALGDSLYISEVKHKAFVKVNEEGTEASAATSVTVGVDSAPPGITADRPFVFVIRERHSGTILFIGKVADPAA